MESVLPRALVPCLVRFRAMPAPLTAEDILPLVKRLTLPERTRLIGLIGATSGGDAAAYRSSPATRDEFTSEEEPLGWDAEGWENVG
jgi:hypothetical protein